MTDSQPTTAYKILSRADWRATLAEGLYEGSPVDRADGYIHLSALDQLAGTAARHYASQSDLMLVEVDLTALATASSGSPRAAAPCFPISTAPCRLRRRGARAPCR